MSISGKSIELIHKEISSFEVKLTHHASPHLVARNALGTVA